LAVDTEESETALTQIPVISWNTRCTVQALVVGARIRSRCNFSGSLFFWIVSWMILATVKSAKGVTVASCCEMVYVTLIISTLT